MGDEKSLVHTRWNCKYHIVFAPKYRRLAFYGEKRRAIGSILRKLDDERTHRYHYDSRHRLVHYTRTQYAEPLVESRYLYDPLGRRVAKRVWRRERDLTGWMSLSRKPEVTWYGWDGDRLTTIRLGRKSLSFSKSVELHDKVIGHYLNIKHYQ